MKKQMHIDTLLASVPLTVLMFMYSLICITN